MPASSTKNNVTKNRKRINFKSKNKLNSALIQSDEFWVIFWPMPEKLQQFWNYRVLLRTAQASKIFIGFRSNENASFFAFAILRCCENSKKAFTHANKAVGMKQFSNMIAIISIDVLKI